MDEQGGLGELGRLEELGRLGQLGRLSDQDLLARLRAEMAGGHAWQARLVAYLGEVDHRKLYAAHACPSMWDFCVRKLGMSEGEAQRRIAAARVVRQFPRALAYLERGDIHLCAVYALRRHLTSDNHDELLREAAGKSTSDVELLIATRFPKPDVAQRIEHVAPQPSLALTPAGDGADARASASEARPRIEPLSATRYRVELTVSADLKAKLATGSSGGGRARSAPHAAALPEPRTALARLAERVATGSSGGGRARSAPHAAARPEP